jgi:formiminotetrahydrofolate cyclodeaminase
MRSDLDVAGLMAAAGARGAMANVETNLDGLGDASYAQIVRSKLTELRARLERAPKAEAPQEAPAS